MKTLLKFLLTIFLVGSVLNLPAANVYVRVMDVTSGPVVNRAVTVTLTYPDGSVVAGPWVLAGDSRTLRTDPTGVATFTNMLMTGRYRMDVQGNPTRSFPFSLSTATTNGTYNVISLMGTNAAVPIFYTADQVDALILGAGFIPMTRAGTNASGYTNAGVVVISADVSHGEVSNRVDAATNSIWGRVVVLVNDTSNSIISQIDVSGGASTNYVNGTIGNATNDLNNSINIRLAQLQWGSANLTNWSNISTGLMASVTQLLGFSNSINSIVSTGTNWVFTNLFTTITGASNVLYSTTVTATNKLDTDLRAYIAKFQWGNVNLTNWSQFGTNEFASTNLFFTGSNTLALAISTGTNWVNTNIISILNAASNSLVAQMNTTGGASTNYVNSTVGNATNDLSVRLTAILNTKQFGSVNLSNWSGTATSSVAYATQLLSTSNAIVAGLFTQGRTLQTNLDNSIDVNTNMVLGTPGSALGRDAGNLTNLPGAQVTGTVPNATNAQVAIVANSVAAAVSNAYYQAFVQTNENRAITPTNRANVIVGLTTNVNGTLEGVTELRTNSTVLPGISNVWYMANVGSNLVFYFTPNTTNTSRAAKVVLTPVGFQDPSGTVYWLSSESNKVVFTNFVGVVYLTNLGNIFGGSLTNGVNLGDAFSSPGGAESTEQFGAGALASSTGGSAFGNGAHAVRNEATALGHDSVAGSSDANYGTAIGGHAYAVGLSTAIGAYSSATNLYSVAIGETSFANSQNAVAIGYGTTVTHSNSIVFGVGATSSAPNQITFGTQVSSVRFPGSGVVDGGFTNGTVITTNLNVGGARIITLTSNVVYFSGAGSASANGLAYRSTDCWTNANGDYVTNIGGVYYVYSNAVTLYSSATLENPTWTQVSGVLPVPSSVVGSLFDMGPLFVVGNITSSNLDAKIAAAGPPGMFVARTNGAAYGLNIVSGNAFGLTNASRNIGVIKYMSGQGAGNGFTDMMNAKSDFLDQIGISHYSPFPDIQYLWFAGASNAIGSNAWNGEIALLGGILQVGDSWHMTSNTLGNHSVKFYMNGGPEMTRLRYITNGYDGYFAFMNMNPFSSGGFVLVPMVGTNTTVGGQIVGTNADAVPIVIENPFGIQIGSIPSSYPIGDTNQAGSYVLLAQSDHPLYISVNSPPYDGETTASQHFWVGFDNRGVTNALLPLAVHFPIWKGNVWSFINPANIDALTINERNGDITISSNAFISYLSISNRLQIGDRTLADYTAAVNINTNVSFNADNVSWTFDSASVHRMGFVKKNAAYPVLAHGGGSPFQIARSSDNDLQSAVSGQTLTPELTIDSSGQIQVIGTYQGATNAISTWPTAAATGGGFAIVNSNATVYILTSTPNSTAWAATNKLAGP